MPPAPGLPAGPYKPYDPHKVGEQVQNNYDFLRELFAAGNVMYIGKSFLLCRTLT